LRSWVQKWASSASAIKLVLSPDAVNAMSQADRFILSVLSSLDGISIWSGEAPPCRAGGQAIAEIIATSRTPLAWAYRFIDAACPNAKWATGTENFLVHGEPQTTGKLLQQLSIAVNTPADMTDQVYRIEIRNELDGISEGFGQRLLTKLEDILGTELIKEKREIVGITYHDRYLNAPLPAALLLDFISALKTAYKDRWSVRRPVELVVAPFQEEKSGFNRPTYVYHNWPAVSDRESAISAAFVYCGMDCVLHSIEKRDAMHARLLEIESDDGHVAKIWLDQGFSYWQAQSPYRQNLRFPFAGEPNEQGQTIAKSRVDLAGQVFSTHLFVER